MPEALFRAALYNAHHPVIAGHPRTRRTYDMQRRYLYWPRTASEVFSYVENFEFCCRHSPSQEHQRWMPYLPQSGFLEFVATGLLGSLAITKQKCCSAGMTTNHCSKLTRAIFAVEVAAPVIATIFSSIVLFLTEF